MVSVGFKKTQGTVEFILLCGEESALHQNEPMTQNLPLAQLTFPRKVNISTYL